MVSTISECWGETSLLWMLAVHLALPVLPSVQMLLLILQPWGQLPGPGIGRGHRCFLVCSPLINLKSIEKESAAALLVPKWKTSRHRLIPSLYMLLVMKVATVFSNGHTHTAGRQSSRGQCTWWGSVKIIKQLKHQEVSSPLTELIVIHGAWWWQPTSVALLLAIVALVWIFSNKHPY